MTMTFSRCQITLKSIWGTENYRLAWKFPKQEEIGSGWLMGHYPETIFSQDSVVRTPHDRGKITSNNTKIWHDSQENGINGCFSALFSKWKKMTAMLFSVVPPKGDTQSQDITLHFSWGSFCLVCKLAMLLTHCSICVLKEKGQKSSMCVSIYVSNSSEQWGGPLLK